MKIIIPLCGFLLAICHCTLQAQPCSVKIKGGTHCTDSTLIADGGAKKLVRLIWKIDSAYISGADTVSSPASMLLVAGGHGGGQAPNQMGIFFDIAVDNAGNVYIADYDNDRVQKWAPGAGSGVTVAGGHGEGHSANQLYRPNGIAIDKKGNVFVADEYNQRIQKWAPGAIKGVTVAGGNGLGGGANQLSYPKGVYVDDNDTLYIADTYNFRIQKWAPGATEGVTVAGGNGFGDTPDKLSLPGDIDFDGKGNMYIADGGQVLRILKWVPGASKGVNIIGKNGLGAAANQIGSLGKIAVDTAGNVYIADYANNRIQKWAEGASTGVTVAGSAAFHRPWDHLAAPYSVAVNKNGEVYAGDMRFYRFRVIMPRVIKYTPVNGNVNKQYRWQTPGNYSVAATFKDGCFATSAVVHVGGASTPLIEPTSPEGVTNLCGNKIDTFIVHDVDRDITFKWKTSTGINILENRGDSIIVGADPGFRDGFIMASGINSACGAGSFDSLAVTGRPFQPVTIEGPKKVPADKTNIQYSTPDLGFVYTWQVPSTVQIVSGQGTAHIMVNWGRYQGDISVTATSDCGTSFKKSHRILVNYNLIAGAVDTTGSVSKSTLQTGPGSVYPNPAVNIATVSFNADKQTKYIIEVQDVTGKTLQRKEAIFASGANKIDIDVSRYAKGMYFVTVTNAAKQKTSFKLMKQ